MPVAMPWMAFSGGRGKLRRLGSYRCTTDPTGGLRPPRPSMPHGESSRQCVLVIVGWDDGLGKMLSSKHCRTN
eukprot:1157178-Pelagomonas_calceolata.AAC.3